MNIYKLIFSLIIVFLPSIGVGSAFNMGDGELWLKMCSGAHSDYSEKHAKELCSTVLLVYQVGAVQQARHLNKKATLCSHEMPPRLNELFIDFIKSDPKHLKADFLDLYPKFLISLDSCKVKHG